MVDILWIIGIAVAYIIGYKHGRKVQKETKTGIE